MTCPCDLTARLKSEPARYRVIARPLGPTERAEPALQKPEASPGPTPPDQDSNLEHTALETVALPVELPGNAPLPPGTRSPFPGGSIQPLSQEIIPGTRAPFPGGEGATEERPR